MSRHRAEPPPPPPRPAAGGRRRAEVVRPVRPRYGRLAALGTALGVTAIAMLGGIGVLPSVATGSTEQDAPARSHRAASVLAAQSSPTSAPSPTPSADAVVPAAPAVDPLAVPADSGSGRRVVFDQSDQRVWLVREDETVARTYLVSGSVTDNLQPGSYDVFSRSAHAIGVDDAGTMRYFVRFTRGPEGGAIGFHDIPVDDGARVQSVADLGTPQSHGCIRQARKDALAMWGFAPIGTPVTVVA